MKKFAIMIAVLVAAVFAVSTVVAAEPPATVTIKAIQKEKPALEFAHKAHAEYEMMKKDGCQTCHHKDAKGKEEGCASCHTKPGEKVDFKKAMHDQCKGCHTKAKKGPTKCDGCHPKK